MMKKKNLFWTAAAGLTLLAACSKNDNPDPVTPPPGGGNESDTIDVRGTLNSNTTWESNKVYRLRGYVYVDAPAAITIEAGTKIISNRDSAGVLVIYKGAKLMAEGTVDKPIVFTSAEADAKAGDLGGIVLVGNAIGNGNHATLEGGVDADHKNFGGNDDHDNSGVLKYLRIEYAGKAVNPGDEINGLSLYAVGDGTVIDYVQVVRGMDDAFEFFGGSVTAKHLVAYNCYDDDYDMDDGFHGKIQFAISIKDPLVTDKTAPGDFSNNLEVDNTNGSSKPFSTTPITHPLLSNFTAVGPNGAPNTDAYHGYGMRWRRGAQFELVNSIFIGGQKAGLDLDDDSTAAYYKEGKSGFRNSFLQAHEKVTQVDILVVKPAILTADELEGLVTGRDGSVIYDDPTDIQLTDPFNNATPNVMPESNSPALTTAAKFEGDLNDSFFEKVNFLGALGTEDWTSGWTIWNK